MDTIGVIGAGQMGAGIAQTLAQHGYRVLLSDIDLAAALVQLPPVLSFTETGAAHAGQHIIDPTDAITRIGDVVLSRKGEDIVAYFLASAFDDADQGVTHVIRGEDLFDFTPVQVILQHIFGPVVTTQ